MDIDIEVNNLEHLNMVRLHPYYQYIQDSINDKSIFKFNVIDNEVINVFYTKSNLHLCRKISLNDFQYIEERVAKPEPKVIQIKSKPLKKKSKVVKNKNELEGDDVRIIQPDIINPMKVNEEYELDRFGNKNAKPEIKFNKMKETDQKLVEDNPQMKFSDRKKLNKFKQKKQAFKPFEQNDTRQHRQRKYSVYVNNIPENFNKISLYKMIPTDIHILDMYVPTLESGKQKGFAFVDLPTENLRNEFINIIDGYRVGYLIMSASVKERKIK